MDAFLDHVVETPRGRFVLRFGFNAFAAFEKEAGRSAFTAIGELERGQLTMASDLRALCWAALVHHQPSAFLEQAGDILDLHPGCVARALRIALPDAGEAGEPRAGKKPTRARQIWRAFWQHMFRRGSRLNNSGH